MSTTIACPHCQGELNAGQLLSELSRGKHRRMTPEHKAKLSASLVKAREALKVARAQAEKAKWVVKPIWTKGVL